MKEQKPSIDDVFQDIQLPSDAEVKRETMNKKISIAKAGKPSGVSPTSETREKLSKATRGVPKPSVSRLKTGSKLSDDHRQAISGALKGKTKSAEHVAAIAKSRKGKPVSAQARLNMNRQVNTPKGVFVYGIREAAQAHGLTYDVMRGLMKKYPDEYYFVDKKKT